ncbi:MAG: hypothetical protein KatS3mg106_054 [Gemmataceae bacterium]|jgi:hypothetical protein|nr:MAG: hypothetical protein KatS3mg106_054 [Gemmataceae bacterium]
MLEQPTVRKIVASASHRLFHCFFGGVRFIDTTTDKTLLSHGCILAVESMFFSPAFPKVKILQLPLLTIENMCGATFSTVDGIIQLNWVESNRNLVMPDA